MQKSSKSLDWIKNGNGLHFSPSLIYRRNSLAVRVVLVVRGFTHRKAGAPHAGPAETIPQHTAAVVPRSDELLLCGVRAKGPHLPHVALGGERGVFKYIE